MASDDISADFPYEPHYVDVLGSMMHYLDEGSGDPVLFLHGNGCSSYIWRNIIPHLAPVARCIAPDLIGMGKSAKPDIEYRFVDHARYVDGLIDALDLRQLTLVLHDWGSPLGFHYAMRHEDNVKALAFFQDAMFTPIHSWEQFTPQQRELFQAFRSPDTGWELVANQNLFLEKVIPGGIVRRLSEEEMRHYQEPYPDPASRKALWRWPQELPIEGQPPDVTRIVEEYGPWLRRTELPKLLLHVVLPEDFRPVPMSGLVDALARAKKHPAVEWCKENLKNIHAVNVGIGIHYVQEDNPHQIGRALREWYGGL